MKEKYFTPEMDITEFDEDIITSSRETEVMSPAYKNYSDESNDLS